jgi:hypothetical protein
MLLPFAITLQRLFTGGAKPDLVGAIAGGSNAAIASVSLDTLPSPGLRRSRALRVRVDLRSRAGAQRVTSPQMPRQNHCHGCAARA